MSSILITLLAIILFAAATVSVFMFFDQEEAQAVGMSHTAASMLGTLVEASEAFRQQRGIYPLDMDDLRSEFDFKPMPELEADFVISDGIACLSMPYREDVDAMLQNASNRIDGSVVTDTCGSSEVTGRRFLALSMDGIKIPVATAFVGGGTPVVPVDPWLALATPSSGRCIQRTGYVDYKTLGLGGSLPAELVRNQKYFSENGEHHLIFQGDGNVVTYPNIKATGTGGNAAKVTIANGLLRVLDANGNTLRTWGREADGSRMVVGNDGYVRTVMGECYNVLWSSHSLAERMANYDVGQRANGFAYGPTVLNQGESVYSPSQEYHIVNQSSDGHVVAYRSSDSAVLFKTGKFVQNTWGWTWKLEPDGLKQYNQNGVLQYTTGRSGRRWGFTDGGRVAYFAPFTIQGETSFLNDALLGYESLISPNGQFILSTNPQFGHGDNRIAIYTNNRAQTRVWEMNKANNSVGMAMKLSVENGAIVQRDNAGNIIWSAGSGGARIGLTNQGKLQLVNSSGAVVFSTP